MNIKCTTWCSVVLNLKVLCVELGGKTIVLFDSVMALSNQSDLPAFFSPRKVTKNSNKFQLMTNRNCSSSEDGIRRLHGFIESSFEI
jgi:hypothetical protein